MITMDLIDVFNGFMYSIVECVGSLNTQVSAMVGGEDDNTHMLASRTNHMLASTHHNGTSSVLETDEVGGSN